MSINDIKLDRYQKNNKELIDSSIKLILKNERNQQKIRRYRYILFILIMLIGFLITKIY